MRFIFSLVFISLFPIVGTQPVGAQDLLRTLRDYHFEKPLQYSAEDPWTRSRLYRWHTGHAGFFYNCDCQEEKRNSPYICWKSTCENSLLPKRSFLRIWTKDIENTRQRIIDGAGACCGKGCACASCRKAGVPCYDSDSSCNQCDSGQCATSQKPMEDNRVNQSDMPSLRSSVSALLPPLPSSQTVVPELPPNPIDVVEPNMDPPAMVKKSDAPKPQITKRRFGLISGRTTDIESPGPVEWRAALDTPPKSTAKSGFSKALEIFKR